MRHKLAKILAASALAAGATTVVASPAMADSCNYVPNQRGYGCVATANHWAYVCDQRADNWGVRIYLQVNGGWWTMAADGNGSADGCGGRHTSGATGDQYYIAYQVCSGENGANTWCGPVKYV